MSFRVTVKPSLHAFTVDSDETVLEAALREGVMLPYGCRNGACGSCKGMILEGQVDYGHYQESTLPPEEKRAGKALFCVARPQTDLTIECQEVNAVKDIQVKTLPCRIQAKALLAPDVARLKLKLPANERLQFLAGQYIDFLLKDGKRRSFSLANAPFDDEFLELHVRRIDNGNFTRYLFDEMKEKTILRFQGPLGTFFLREESDKPILFLAGGTGFAPIKSMIEDALAKHLDRTMVLYWGVRSKIDLYLPDLPGRWQQENPTFTFIPVLSDPTPADAWPGRTGFVHQAVLDDFDDLSGFEVYACGSPAMVEAAHRTFTKERGLPENAFYSDPFTFAADSTPAGA